LLRTCSSASNPQHSLLVIDRHIRANATVLVALRSHAASEQPALPMSRHHRLPSMQAQLRAQAAHAVQQQQMQQAQAEQQEAVLQQARASSAAALA
jgi:hypothetical protein